MSVQTVAPPRKTTVPRKGRWPGPRGKLITGCLRPVQNDPLNFYRQTWETYGDYVEIRIFAGMYYYFLAAPSAVEHVLSKNHKNYRKPEVLTGPIRMLTGNGIFASEGELWLRQRRLLQPVFLRNRVATFVPHFAVATQKLIDEWDRGADGRVIDVAPDMMRLALRIASTALFSADVITDADEVGSAFRTAFDYVSRKMNRPFMPPLSVPTRRNLEFKRSKALLDRVVLELIASRRKEQAQADVLSLLLAAKDEESGAGMSDQQIKEEVLTFFTAGHETTAAALAWAWYLLAQNPQEQENLHDEAAAVLQGRMPSADDLSRLPFASAVFEETMRLYPPAWGLPRETIEEDVIDGYPLRKKSILTVSQWVTHRHPDYWSEPDRFQPERFMPGAAEGRPKYAYFPFGGGPRACIGNFFALLEGPLVLSALAQRFHFTLVPEHEVIPDATFTLRPKTGVKLVIRKRR